MLDAEERHQGQYPALSVIVRAHDNRHVFERGGDQERPDNQREHSDGHRWSGTSGPVERGFQGVERARADIAVDDAKRAERECPEAAVGRSSFPVCHGPRACHHCSIESKRMGDCLPAARLQHVQE